MKSEQIENQIASYFGIRRNLIVPNVSWGLSLHECDVLILTPANWLYEVEIKVCKYDLHADKQKRHGHCSNKIRLLYFAIPEYLVDHIDLIPERAGILVCGRKETRDRYTSREWIAGVRKIRNPAINKDARQVTDNERYTLARLGAMRIWGLKKKLQMNFPCSEAQGRGAGLLK